MHVQSFSILLPLLISSLVAFAILVLLTRAIAMVVVDGNSLAFSSRRGEAKRMIVARGSCVHPSSANALICGSLPLFALVGAEKSLRWQVYRLLATESVPYAFEK